MKRLLAILVLAAMAGLLLGSQQIIVVKKKAAAAGTTVTYSAYCNGDGTGCTFSAAPSAHQAVVIDVWQLAGDTITTVCDGTGTGGCTGSSTYTSITKYVQGAIASQIWYTCNFAGSTNITITGVTSGYTTGVVATGNITSSCSDGYNKAQGTGTAALSGTITTTNAASLLIGFATNDVGGTATAGNDGNGHSLVERAERSGANNVATYNETSTGTYSASYTVPSSNWNMEVIAIK
jgi:hypothetical protein